MNKPGGIHVRDADLRKGRTKRFMPVVNCPVCGQRAYTRTSEEISPETRRLYYVCSHWECGMRWQALLTVERVVSPSGISPNFRPAQLKPGKPPGHEYGQSPPPLLEFMGRTSPA